MSACEETEKLFYSMMLAMALIKYPSTEVR
jgi:hypothetical protein